MKQFDQWWLPDAEQHLQKIMLQEPCTIDGRLTYQYRKYAAALALLQHKPRRTAIDVGAHVGLWSFWMARDFAFVEAFEPISEHAACWLKNISKTYNNATLHLLALGATEATVYLDNKSTVCTGSMEVVPQHPALEHNPIAQVALDSYAYKDVDLLKIDVEGYEQQVLEGAVITIARCAPVIVIEQRRNTDGLEWLYEHGYEIATRAGEDYVMVYARDGRS